MPRPQSRRPMLPLAAALAAGCAAGPDLALADAGWLLGLAAVALVLALVRPHGRLAPAAVLAAAAAVGAAAAAVEARSWDAAPLSAWAAAGDLPVRLSGRLAEDARPGRDHTELIVDVTRLEARGRARAATGRARIRVYGEPPPAALLAGEGVRLWARLAPPRGLLSPGAFDAVAWARRRGVHANGVCKSGRLVERLAGQGPGPVARVRGAARDALMRHVPPGVEQGLVLAMVLGDRSGVDAETSEAFRVAGTYHVLALSGAQVALLVGLLLAASRRAGVAPDRAAFAISAVVGGYALFVGAEIPVVRAALMAAVLLLGRGFDLDADALNLLGLAAALLLLARPSWVGDVGFQLSFVATAAILVLAAPIASRLRPLPLRLELAMAASLAAQAALTPLLLEHFQRLAPAALLLNLAAAPLASGVLLAGLLVVGAAVLAPPTAPALGALAWALAHGLLRSGEIVSGARGLDWRLPPMGWLAGAAWLAGLFAAADERRRPRALVLVVAAGAWLALGPAPQPADGRLHLTILDVGQGDAIALQSPGGRTALVDAGGGPPFDAGAAVVAPFLLRRGVRRLDFLLLTHRHADHVGGAAAVLAAFPVGALWHGPAPDGRPILPPGVAPGVPRLAVARGARILWDGVDVSVLGPDPASGGRLGTNDASVVIVVGLGDVRFALAADVGTRGEAAARPPPAVGLKVAHHGSVTSTSPRFLERLAPEVAVISCGVRNRFSHPHPAVVERLRRRGVRLLRTDRDGSVTLSTDGARVWLTSHSGARESWTPRRSMGPGHPPE